MASEAVRGRLVLEDRVAVGRVSVEDGVITGVELDAASTSDADALPYLAPGFVDVHVHGWGGFDAMGGAGALDGVTHGVGPLTRLQLDPLANTGVDPLDNGLGTQVADFKPVGTNLVTDHVTKGGAAADLPVVGGLTRGLLP